MASAAYTLEVFLQRVIVASAAVVNVGSLAGATAPTELAHVAVATEGLAASGVPIGGQTGAAVGGQPVVVRSTVGGAASDARGALPDPRAVRL